MAIAAAMCSSFKSQVLTATHNFSASGGNSFKLALYAEGGGGKSSTTATLGAATTAFTTTGEVASSGTYVTGGLALTNIDPSTTGTTGITDFADKSFTTATITAMGALIYNDTNSDKAVCVLDFGSNKTSTAGTFTIAFPAADASNAIIRIA
jgi:VCBS repeat-containing protein|tara:strand:- start:178 stop:633 length:456 start_codon:yes stop_codon:yes gene_type:complete